MYGFIINSFHLSFQHTSVSSTCLDQEVLNDEWLNAVGDSDPFHFPEEEWVHDSLLSSYSPLR